MVHPSTVAHEKIAHKFCKYLNDEFPSLVHKCYNDLEIIYLDIPDKVKNPTKQLFWEKIWY